MKQNEIKKVKTGIPVFTLQFGLNLVTQTLLCNLVLT